MFIQKYLYKGLNVVKLPNLVLNLIFTLILSVAGFLSFFISPSYSLGWHDEEWLKAGCPKNISGNWFADNPINKNLKSYLFAILGAEYILRWLPIGTHDWNKFLTPQELESIVIKNNFTLNEVIGMKFNPFSQKWGESSDTSVNYISTFLKN